MEKWNHFHSSFGSTHLQEHYHIIKFYKVINLTFSGIALYRDIHYKAYTKIQIVEFWIMHTLEFI